MLLLDIDHFKRINDSYGHQAGDEVICHVAAMLRATVRRGDLTGRIGGEEFVAICLETDGAGVLRLAERLRAVVETQAFPIEAARHSLRCTVTIGISQQFHGTPGLGDALRQADSALYRGKEAGRKQVEWAGPSAQAMHLA